MHHFFYFFLPIKYIYEVIVLSMRVAASYYHFVSFCRDGALFVPTLGFSREKWLFVTQS